MIDQPDGVEVVLGRADARALVAPPLIVLEPLLSYLDEHGLGTGPLAWSRIGEGQSNVTYLLERGDTRFVLRRGPRPPFPPSTHDMAREARIQRLLAQAGVPVPAIITICQDQSVLGVPFYLMEFIPGVTITHSVPVELDQGTIGGIDHNTQRRALSEATVDALVNIHRVDISHGQLATLGRPEGYLRRQVSRFATLWGVSGTRELPEVQRLAAWLEANRPVSVNSGVVHGDFRMGNLMFAPQAPATVLAILDWEMATIGDPIADLGYLTATWAEPGSEPTPMDLTTATREPGFLRRDDLIARYGAQMDVELSTLPWYQALALWKAAIFCEAIYTRWLNGERPEDTTFGASLGEGVPALLRAATAFSSGLREPR